MNGPESQCRGKIAHAHRKAAVGALLSLARATGAHPRTLAAYRCQFCSAWHVGNRRHAPKPRRRRR